MLTATSEAAQERAASVHSSRLQRARDIITTRDLWGMLQYMEDCPIGNQEDGGGPEAMHRYMVVTGTDGGADGWIDLKETINEAEELVRGLLTDEWGLVGVWDLDRVSSEPLSVRLTLRITYPRTGASHD